MTLLKQLRDQEFEFHQPIMKLVYYRLERKICEILLRRTPPKLAAPNLLNLGCGPHIYAGWVNADDYAIKRRLREQRFRPNWNLDITRPWMCPDNHWDGIFTEHVIEHVSYSEALLVLEECLRTLKAGAWIRISVPDLKKYVDYYAGKCPDTPIGNFPHPTLAISFLTQMHLHRSTWDDDLMSNILRQIGFTNVSVVTFGQGTDARLIKDDVNKARESLYVEARKPPRMGDTTTSG